MIESMCRQDFFFSLFAKLICIGGYLWLVIINISLIKTINNNCKVEVSNSYIFYICDGKVLVCFTIIFSIIELVFIFVILTYRFHNIYIRFKQNINKVNSI
jgi:hypothetical protein